MSTLGQRISDSRRALSLTQDQLAEKLGVSSQAVSKWENDLSCPDIFLLPQLCDLLGVTLDFLLRGDSSPVVYVPEEKRDFNKLILRISVLSSDNDRVNINLPLPLIRACIELGMSLPEINGAEALKSIDLGQIMTLVENGAIGKLVEVDDSDGDHVEIVVE